MRLRARVRVRLWGSYSILVCNDDKGLYRSEKWEVSNHEKWMIRSYALCFAAVTLRIWLGLSGHAELAFMDVYPIIAWLC